MFVRYEDGGAGDDSSAQDGSEPYQDPAVKQQQDAAVLDGQFATEAAASQGYSRSAMIELSSASKTLRRQAASSRQQIDSSAGDLGADDPFSDDFFTSPTELTFEDRGFREADMLTCSFPFQDLGIFPLIIREIRVEAWVGTVRVEDFATPDNWRLRPIASDRCVRRFNGYVDLDEMEFDAQQGLVHLKARSYISVLIDNHINPLAKAHLMHAEEEYLTTYINRILSEFPPTSGEHGDAFRAVWYGGAAAAEPKLSRKMLMRSLQTAASRNAAAGQSSTDPTNAQPDPENEAADPSGTGDAAPGGLAGIAPAAVTAEGMPIWDMIVQACELCGVMPLYRPSLPVANGSVAGVAQTVEPADYLLLVPPEAFLDDVSSATQISGGSRDGFRRQFTDDQGNTFGSDVRFMVWGHNLSKMKLSRKMGKARPQAVEVHAYNPDARGALRQLVSRFPKHVYKHRGAKGRVGAKGASKMGEKGHGKIDSVRIFEVQGVRDQLALDSIAVSLYHQLARQELTMEIETDELASYIDPAASAANGKLVPLQHNDQPDLLHLCAGTPVHVTVAKQSTDSNDLTISTLSEFYDLTGQNILKLLTDQNNRWGAWRSGGPLDQQALESSARKIQAAYQRAKLPSVYYCRGIQDTFGAGDDIFHSRMELTNYMPANDPKNLDVTSQQMNDRRKKTPTTVKGRQQVSESNRTAAVVDKASRIGAGRR
jgi:hypothetical protein